MTRCQRRRGPVAGSVRVGSSLVVFSMVGTPFLVIWLVLLS